MPVSEHCPASPSEPRATAAWLFLPNADNYFD